MVLKLYKIIYFPGEGSLIIWVNVSSRLFNYAAYRKIKIKEGSGETLFWNNSDNGS